jgi:hypothetical protein
MIVIKIFILIIVLLFILIRENRDMFYFRIKNNTIDHLMPQINIDNHHSVYYKNDDSNYNCLLVSHGNSSNIYCSKKLIDKIKKIYKGDIYCYEYPGFGKCKGKLSINNCVNEQLFWLEYLSKKYTFIDIWGYSIGGGIIAQTIKKIPDNISNKIRKIYYHNTFSCIKNVIKKYNIFSYILYKILCINDLNTNNEFKNNFFKNKEIIILHSVHDNIVLYDEAIINYNLCKKLGYNVKLINIEGDHTIFDLKNIDFL